MKREIKFRGKCIYNNLWEYGWLYCEADRFYIKDYVNDTVQSFRIDPNTIGQFTGLFDSNGREIYEGDILRISISKDGIAEVKWNTKCAMFVEQMKNSAQWYNLEGRKEIIGNIYDTPELLKGGNK